MLYLANARIPTEKAHGIQIMKMCEAFAENGLDVELVIPKRLDGRGGNLFAFYEVRSNFKIRKIFNLDLYILGKFGYWIRAISFAFFASFYALKHQADFIYSRDELPLFILCFFKKNIYFEVHTSKYNFFIKEVLKKSSGIISISHGLCHYFTEKGFQEEKFFLASDAVDLEIFYKIKETKLELKRELGLPEHGKVVGYVGKYKTMGKGKGVDLLIRIFPKVLQMEKTAFLLLVGVYDDELKEVCNIFDSLNIPPKKYKIVTHVKQNLAMRYVKASDVLVMNYPNISHYAFFMSPLKLFEYMASGNPIISTDLPSVREVLNERNAILVKSDDQNELLKGILRFFGNQEESSKLAEQASRDILEHSWTKRAMRIINFIKSKQ